MCLPTRIPSSLKLAPLSIFLVLASCSDAHESDMLAPTPSEAVVVVSDDGSAMLSIPAGALPEGVVGEDIHLYREDQRIQNFSGDALLWKLSPDGLQLSAVATLELQVDVPAGALFQIDHFSAGTIESLTTEFERELLSQEGNLKQLTVEVAHFSDVGVFVFHHQIEEEQVLLAEWETPALSTVIDEVATPVLRLTPPSLLESSYSYTDSEGVQVEVVLSYDTMDWNHAVEWQSTGEIGPASAFGDPTDVSTPFADLSQEFRCNDVGEYTLTTLASTTLRGARTITFSDQSSESSTPLAMAFVRSSTDSVCTEDGLYNCTNPLEGCTDIPDDCGGLGGQDLDGCQDYSLADITHYQVVSCSDGITVRVTLASPMIPVADDEPASFPGRFTLALYLGGFDDDDGMKLNALTFGGHSFEVSPIGSSVNTGNSAVLDAAGRIVIHISQATIDGYELDVETMHLTSYLRYDASPSTHRRDKTDIAEYLCPSA